MKVLLLNQTFHPDVVATAQQASDLAVKLAERGHRVTVVCSRRAYDSPQKQYPRNEIWQGVRIRRISSLGFGKTSRGRRAADFGSYLANCVCHLATLDRFDVVIAMTSPPLISWLGALFTRIKGGRLVFWVMDLNPDEALAAGWLRSESKTTKCLEAMLRYSLGQATTIVALDRFMAKRIEAKGVSTDKIKILPPWAHDQMLRYDNQERDRFRRDHGLEGKYVVMYSGNHSPCHPLATLLEAARRLRERHDITFCFIGGGSEFDTVSRFAERNALKNIVTIPYQPLSGLAASLSAADLHTVVMGDRFVGIVHPSKVYNIRALGIPYLYIGPEISHIAEMAPTFSAAHGDVEAVVGRIECGARAQMPRLSPPQGLENSQRQLVGKLIAAIESANSRDEAIRSQPVRTSF